MVRAEDWLNEQTPERPPVFLPEEIPAEVLAELRSRDLVLQVPGGVVALRNPNDDPADVLRTLVWPIVETLARKYAPAAVERDSAVRLHLGRTDPGAEIRLRQTGETRWKETLVPGVTLRVERGDVDDVEQVAVGEAMIPVDPAEVVLLGLPIQFLRGEGLRDVALWLKSLVLSRPALVAAYRRNPRPVVLKRIEHIARDAGNEELADLLADVLAAEQDVRIGRDRTGVGSELVVPPLVVSTRTTRRPWLDRLGVMMQESVGEIQRELATVAPSGLSSDIDSLVARARAARAYDAYHSTSIEGYRLRPEEVARLLGESGADVGAIEDIRSRMAILGYGAAFDHLVGRLEARGHVPLTPDLALELYVELFRPSVEAGLVQAAELRGWREEPVYIRGTLYVPPHPQKVAAMMDYLFQRVDEAGEDEEGASHHPLLPGILAHLWFVWIHPFPDGNGRIARFLMNTAFLNAGQPWRTIPVEQRDRYFEALRRAQLDEDYAPFARFIAELSPAADE